MGTETVSNGKEAVVAEAPSELEKQIIRQVEYYFGDYNLTRDKFLREQLQIDDGWVPLETMVKFNRLKKLSSDFNVIIEALKKSSKQLMEVNDESTKIRRRSASELPEDYRARQSELEEKTLYVKGFKKTNTLDDLLDFFKEFGVENILMRRIIKQSNKPFKGSVFATFDTKEDAEKFLTTKGIKYGGTELLKEWKKDYVKRKDELYKTIREEKAKKMQAKLEAKEGKSDNAEDKDKESKTDDSKDGQEIKDMVRGCLLKLMNLNKECNRESIKAVFQPLGDLIYIDYHYGMPTATIRFESAVANSVLEKIPEEDGKRKIKIGSSDAEVTSIEGDEEEEYWRYIFKHRMRTREAKNFKFGNKGKKKWGKHRGQRHENDKAADEGSEPPKKKVKTESTEETSKSSEKMDVASSDIKQEAVKQDPESKEN